jgi:hypothetical protein
VQRQRHDREAAVRQHARDLQARGAAVEDDRLPVGDHVGDGLGDAAFDGAVLVLAQRERRLLTAQRHAPGATAVALQHALLRESLQVTAHGHLGGAGQLGQLRDAQPADPPHRLGDLSVSLHAHIEHHHRAFEQFGCLLRSFA